MNNELRFFRGLINAITWLIVGMVFMARMYSAKYSPAGADYIGWDTVAVVLGGLVGMHLVIWIDPSFREQR